MPRRMAIYLVVYVRMLVLILLRRPYKLSLLLTDGCNLRCQICSQGETARPVYLSLEEVIRIWEAFTFAPCWINIVGGEPMLTRDLERILDFFAGLPRAKLITLTTNGQLDCAPLVARVLQRARRTVLYVSVSVDGFAPEHDAARGRPRAFERAWRTWEHLAAAQREQPLLEAGISTTVSRVNLRSVASFVEEVVQRCPALSINLAQASDYYRNGADEAFWNLPRRETVDALRAIQAALPRWGAAALLRLSALELAIAFLEERPLRSLPCTSYVHNVLVSADLGLRDCTLRFRPWNDLGGSRADRVEAIAAAIRAPRARRRAVGESVRATGCERTCHSPCEKYVHLVNALVDPRRALFVLRLYLRACWQRRRVRADRRARARALAAPACDGTS